MTVSTPRKPLSKAARTHKFVEPKVTPALPKLGTDARRAWVAAQNRERNAAIIAAYNAAN